MGFAQGALFLIGSCAAGSETHPRPGSNGGDADGSIVVGDRQSDCRNLECRQQSCPSNSPTSITGTVYAPNGKLPLYNVIVYVPNSPLQPFSSGVSCDRCGVVSSGSPLVTALSDDHGVFRLTNVPAGPNVPLVVQVGKWRRQVTIPEVKPCEETVLTDPELTRLPRSRKEGDLPHIAVTTGGCDMLECLLPKLGVDPGELGVDGEDKPIIHYAGAQSVDQGLKNMTNASSLWGSSARLKQYDMVVFSCECEEHIENKGSAAYQAVTDYLSAGGRVFGTDYQYIWYKNTPDPALRQAIPVDRKATGTSPLKLDTSFPKGKALADWKKFVDPASNYGELVPIHVFDSIPGSLSAKSRVWATSADDRLSHPRIISANVPVGVPTNEQCGRALHLDVHVSDENPSAFPSACGSNVNEAEQALAFFLFDLSSCILPDDKTPEPPPPPPR